MKRVKATFWPTNKINFFYKYSFLYFKTTHTINYICLEKHTQSIKLIIIFFFLEIILYFLFYVFVSLVVHKKKKKPISYLTSFEGVKKPTIKEHSFLSLIV